jgi:hypothetical protein
MSTQHNHHAFKFLVLTILVIACHTCFAQRIRRVDGSTYKFNKIKLYKYRIKVYLDYGVKSLKYYDVDPESLPDDIHGKITRQLMHDYKHAGELYAAKKYSRAARYYKFIIKCRNYFSKEQIKKMEVDNIKQRAEGKFLSNGEWVTEFTTSVELQKPPLLPVIPLGLRRKSFKESIAKAIANYKHDQVSAYLTFREALDRKKNGPSKQQAEWLTDAAAVCRSRALAVVRKDFLQAIDIGDIRAALVTSLIAKKIHPSGLGDKKSLLPILKNRLFSPEPPAQSVWKLENVNASEIEGAYSEFYSDNQTILITPKKGSRYVQVTAKVTNVSKQSDLPYIRWAFDMGLLITTIPAYEAATKKPRLAMREFIFLVTAGGDWFVCDYVCVYSSVLNQASLSLFGKDGKLSGVTTIGGYVFANNSFKMDVLFLVPKGINDAKLLVLGANPKPIVFKPAR